MADFLTVQDMKDDFTICKGNLGGAGDTEFLQWGRYLDQELYEPFINTNPEDYLLPNIIKTIIDTSIYAIPSNFQTSYIGGLYQTESSTDYYALNYDAEVAEATVGETITGGTSGATGVVSYITDYGTTGTLTLTSVSGTFQDNEPLTGSSTFSGTSNGTAQGFKFSDNKLSVTNFGSSSTGYWLDSTNINITPKPDEIKVYVFRYIPLLSELTSVSQETIVPIRYKQNIRNIIEVFWDQWRQTPNAEVMSSQRSQEAIKNLIRTLRKVPRVMRMKSTRQNYY